MRKLLIYCLSTTAAAADILACAFCARNGSNGAPTVAGPSLPRCLHVSSSSMASTGQLCSLSSAQQPAAAAQTLATHSTHSRLRSRCLMAAPSRCTSSRQKTTHRPGIEGAAAVGSSSACSQQHFRGRCQLAAGTYNLATTLPGRRCCLLRRRGLCMPAASQKRVVSVSAAVAAGPPRWHCMLGR